MIFIGDIIERRLLQISILQSNATPDLYHFEFLQQLCHENDKILLERRSLSTCESSLH